jgi:hypothetical protein
MQSTLEISKKIFLLKDIHLFKFYKYFFRWRRIYIKIILCDNQRKKSYYIHINSSKIISHSSGLKKPEYFTPMTQLSIINILKNFKLFSLLLLRLFQQLKFKIYNKINTNWYTTQLLDYLVTDQWLLSLSLSTYLLPN